MRITADAHLTTAADSAPIPISWEDGVFRGEDWAVELIRRRVADGSPLDLTPTGPQVPCDPRSPDSVIPILRAVFRGGVSNVHGAPPEIPFDSEPDVIY